MNKRIASLLVVSAFLMTHTISAQTILPTSSINYVRTIQFLTFNSTNPAANEKIESISYYDGLGKLAQKINIGVGEEEDDVITTFEYDGVGRLVRQYLPRVRQGHPSLGSYAFFSFAALNSMYNTEKYEYTLNPYSETLFDRSPINFSLKVASAGNDWAVNFEEQFTGDDRTIQSAIDGNTTSEVIEYGVDYNSGTYDIESPVLTNDGFYSIEELIVKISYGEHHELGQTNDDFSTREYSDKNGRTILTTSYNGTETLETYYVYDKFGNLCFVIPPLADAATIASSISEQDKLCYQYKYDNRKRLIEKKLPGKELGYIVYDKLDRPVLTQDGNQRANSEWLFTKYDVFGRIIYTGVYDDSGSRQALQAAANTHGSNPQVASDFYEVRESNCSLSNERVINGANVDYSNNAFPNTEANMTVLSINYFDTHCQSYVGSIPPSVYGEYIVYDINGQLKGLPTHTFSKVLGTSHWIAVTLGYDKKGQIIWSNTINDLFVSDETTETKLNFSDLPLESKTVLTINSVAQDDRTSTYSYDGYSRLVSETFKVGSNDEVIILNNSYDNLGVLETKHQHQFYESSSGDVFFGQEIDFEYTVRGWLEGINKQ